MGANEVLRLLNELYGMASRIETLAVERAVRIHEARGALDRNVELAMARELFDVAAQQKSEMGQKILELLESAAPEPA